MSDNSPDELVKFKRNAKASRVPNLNRKVDTCLQIEVGCRNASELPGVYAYGTAK